MPATTHTMAIYSDHHLHLACDLHVQQLIVHLGRPGPTINLGKHKFSYDEIELIGEGEFRIMRNGIVAQRLERTMIRYALEFRSGSYFVNVDRKHGGTRDEARLFNSELHARLWFDKFAPWVWYNGGIIVPVEGAAP